MEYREITAILWQNRESDVGLNHKLFLSFEKVLTSWFPEALGKKRKKEKKKVKIEMLQFPVDLCPMGRGSPWDTPIQH